MNAKQLITLAAIAFAGTAAMADDITMVNETFASTRSRAEVNAEVLQARTSGVAQFSTERDAQTIPAQPTAAPALTREQVRADRSKAPRTTVVTFNPAA